MTLWFGGLPIRPSSAIYTTAKLATVNAPEIEWDTRCISAMEWLRSSVGEPWLLRADEPNHPLRQAWRTYAGGQREWLWVSSQSITPVLRAVGFAEVVQRIASFPSIAAGVATSDSRFRDQLMARALRRASDFDGAEFEAIIGDLYSNRLRVALAAVVPHGRPTHDFLLRLPTGLIEVECKARASESPTARLIDVFRDRLLDALSHLLNRVPENYGLEVVCDDVPQLRDVQPLVAEIRQLLSSGRECEATMACYRLKAQILAPRGVDLRSRRLPFGSPIPAAPDAVVAFLEKVETDRGHWGGTMVLFQGHDGGPDVVRNPRAIALRVRVTPDHTDAVLEMIRQGRKQLSGRRPGVVFAKCLDFYGDEQWRYLGRRLRGVLRANARISGVVLWHLALQSMVEPTTAQFGGRWQVLVLRNESARWPLPPSFHVEGVPSAQHGVEVLSTRVM